MPLIRIPHLRLSLRDKSKLFRLPMTFFGTKPTARGFATGITQSSEIAPVFRPSEQQFFASSPLQPVLNTLVKRASVVPSLSLERTAVVYVHHALHSSIQLLRANFQLGLDPRNTFVLDKHYSESKTVVEETKKLGVHYQPPSAQLGLGKFYLSFTSDINRLWSKVLTNVKNIDNLIIMDHGGYALAFVPAQIVEKYNVVGIEKTTAGLINPHLQGLPFPIIETASCAAKKILESPLIAEAVITKLTPLIPISASNLTCGVIGYGAVGKAVANKLLSMGHKVIVYDNDPNQLKGVKGCVVTNELSAIVAIADYIFGCTGRDVATSIDNFRLCTRDKTLISCTSEDKEFLSLLQLVQRKQNGKMTTKPLNDVVYQTDMGAKIRILRGGFPVNFDESGESVPAKDIQLTRALVFASALQARCFLNNPDILTGGGSYALDPGLQKFVVNEWLKYQPGGRFPEEIINKFQVTRWIAENSGGVYKPCDVFQEQTMNATVNKKP